MPIFRHGRNGYLRLPRARLHKDCSAALTKAAAMLVTYKMLEDPGLTVETNRFLIKHEADMPPLPPYLAVQPRRVVTMPYRLFEVLRELAADTRARQTTVATVTDRG